GGRCPPYKSPPYASHASLNDQQRIHHERDYESIAMGFLKNFFTDVYATQAPARPATGFNQLSEQELEAHLGVARYGEFELTDAVRPSYNLEVVPSAGYRHDTYRDEENRAEVPVLMAAVTRPSLMDSFMSLIEVLGDEVDVVLETSHGNDGSS